ncbi:hypothetical protein BO85DRAFT_463026 [Aspergillus piperis CBS 112811]|uniref:nitric-oxide synthase (NADPH) n=1 Tax=Aspergillus piperis CBS 112811 TaxID=1448313 RepID=A0A8G1QXT2_9EURO|nr:hypothetical protein BO85DRAFT_463026 [Aspergillus piperis CBS 112811]RAH53320.1 hypothetical protein BO85DRAFT_463026 [Aspergillus piperis CBS 112811]
MILDLEPAVAYAGYTKISHDSGAAPSTRCPFEEYERILEKNPILAPTGCTEESCQAGRLIHSAEPKVGKNRPLEVVKNEAVAFLWQLWQEGIYTEDRYLERRAQVLEEIARSAKTTIVWDQGYKRRRRTCYGLRLAWKNSRRCIMRSRYQDLGLCDRRHIHTSVGMATALLEEATKAFNGGQIKPTVFVFPPKSVDGSGPMFWDKQVLNFAGYELEDGSIVGDPSNVKLTQDIIDLGWAPPRPKTPWDLLPIVAMAENDAPALVEVPDDLRRLRWYQFPALIRLGFDIGGLQYTATPFIEWYMDAEIGVRNLTDTFRFDALPEVVNAIGFVIDAYRAKPDRAQTMLNYAVRWSFLQHGVTCGSIIPVWHHGGAPNYQPNPMICRNRYDPVNSWQRRKGSTEAVPALLVRNGNTWVTEALTRFATDNSGPKRCKLTESPSKEQPCTVHISYCSQVASTTGSGAFHANKADFAKALGHFRHTLKIDFFRVCHHLL